MDHIEPGDARVYVEQSSGNVPVQHGSLGCSVLSRNGYKLLGRPPGGPLSVSTMYGFRMELDPLRHKGVDASIYFNGTYEPAPWTSSDGTLRPAIPLSMPGRISGS